MRDDKTGRVYYYNARSGVSQWEKPVPKLPPVAQSAQSDQTREAAESEEESTDAPAETEELTELPWEMLRDPSTG